MKKLLIASLAAVAILFANACQQKEQNTEASNPELVSVIPVKGTAGSTVIISGLHFSEKMTENTVSFGGAEAVVRAATANRLTVTAPENEDGEYPITVTVNGKKADGISFTYATPVEPEMTITSLSPSSGFTGDEVAILGENFSPVATDMNVVFGEKAAEIKQASASVLRVIVPENEKGSVGVVVTYGTKTATALFTYLNLAITETTPEVGVEGTEVTIKGEGFGETVEANTVLVNGAPVQIKSASETQLVVVMPKLPAGTYSFTVRARGHEVNGGSYTVEVVNELAITGNQPEAGGSGTIVIISGSGFSEVPEENTVTLGATALPVKAATSTALAVEIPSMEDGTYEFTVKVADKQVTGGKFNFGKVWYVETVAGSGTRKTVDGVGSAASFDILQDLTMAPDGTVWVSQRSGKGKDAVRILNPSTWTVSTAAGTDNTDIAGFNPWGLSFGADGNCWVAVKDKKTGVVKISTDKTVTSVTLPSHKLTTNLMSVLSDKNGNIYLLNRNSGTAGKESYLSVFDKNLELKNDFPLLLFAEYMIFNKDESKIILSTYNNGGIYEVNMTTGEYKLIAGTGVLPKKETFTDGEAGNPLTATIGRVDGMSLAADGTIWFTDFTAKVVRTLTPDASGDYSKGTVKTVAGTLFTAGKDNGEASSAKFETNFAGIQVLSDGSVLVADGLNYVIRRIYAK